ncbi:histidine phosphatase family protein [Adhaeretor mobilis]|uniref:Phosphoserine phosphatase 1 n=1 Tax=Adhaeretor mobilis TaxID=1930276 RepID=A0A517MRF5_9BACT|nr:histidine phosphatase family protein [Adhaeretor mobilis]QDS97455.1 Phosphoserine phosphatase 1 [Adhaeretor mobilis]
MLTLYLIRTGDTEYDGQGRIQGTLDIPLSADGRLQVQKAAQELAEQQPPISTLYTGLSRSVLQTAQLVGEQLKLKPKKLTTLGNLDHGLWQGMLVDEVRENQPKVYKRWRESPESVCPPEGETLSSAKERLQKAIDKLAKKHKEGTIALTLPRPLSAVLHSLLSQEKLVDLWHVEEEGATLWEKLSYSPEAKDD